VDSSGLHACAIEAPDSVVCWGRGKIGEPGVSNCADCAQSIPPEGTFIDVSTGHNYTCGVRSDGSLTCWGGDQDVVYSFLTVPPAGDFVEVYARAGCALSVNSELVCWGEGTVMEQVTPIGKFTTLASSNAHVCALQDSGAMSCWGRDDDGQVSGIPSGPFTDLAVGSSHTCGLRSTGKVECWGSNFYNRSTPPDGLLFEQITAGTEHNCGVRRGGRIACWGRNTDGEADPPEGSFLQVSCGGKSCCAIAEDKSIQCWGLNIDGQASPP